MDALNEALEISYKHQLTQARRWLNNQTLLIVAGALLISFLLGYVYRDNQTNGENHA